MPAYQFRKLNRPWAVAVLMAIALALGVLAWQPFQHSLEGRKVPETFAVPETLKPLNWPYVVVGGAEPVDLSGEAAHYIVTTHSTSPSEAIQQFYDGRGTPFGDLAVLAGATPASENDVLFVLFTYKTLDTNPVLFRYRSFMPLLATIWDRDPEDSLFRLLSVTGPDAPHYLRAAPGLNISLIPSLELSGTAVKPREVLVRIDSAFQFWSIFTLYDRYSFHRARNASNYFDGVFLGAMVVAMGIALYGLYQRRSFDYLLFLTATAVLAIWYLVRGEHIFFADWILVRRWLFIGPVSAYFLLHGLGLARLIYPKDSQHRGALSVIVKIPIVFALAYAACALTSSLIYSVAGIDTPSTEVMEFVWQWQLVVVPICLLLTVCLAPNRNVPGFKLLVVVELTGAFGAIVQFLHFSTTWIEGALVDVLIQYPLPIEVLIWALALTARFRYLEMIAKRRVKNALREEEARVRTEMQATVTSKEQAIVALDQSYQALADARASMLTIFGTGMHAAKNLLLKLGGHIERLQANKDPVVLARTNSALAQLETLTDTLNKLDMAIHNSRDGKNALAAASSLLSWHCGVMINTLRRRGIDLEFTIDDAARGKLVDGFHFSETIRELLSNVSRYAMDNSLASVSLRHASNSLTLMVSNRGELRQDESQLRFGWPVSPAVSTLNGESSSGRGLSNLKLLLAAIGGSVAYDSAPPDIVTITASFPTRDNP